MAPNNEAQLLRKSKKDLIAHFKERETRIKCNNKEALDNRIQAEQSKTEELKSYLANVFPVSEKWTGQRLFYFKPGWVTGSKFALAKRDKLTITHYQIGCMIFELPASLKILDYPVVLLAYFDNKHKFCHWGMVSRNLNKIETFHTTEEHICLGSAQNETNAIPNVEKPETVAAAFDRIKDILSTLNPYSFLSRALRKYPQSFVPTYDYIVEQRHRWAQKHGETHCGDCGIPLDECGCPTCEYCERHAADCECSFCEICERHTDNCPCSYCEDCGQTWNSDYDVRCDCCWCPNCGERVESRFHDTCECPRCSGCRRIEDECMCDEFIAGEISSSARKVWQVSQEQQAEVN